MPDRSTCRSCEAPIEWAYTVKGARIPLDIVDDEPRTDANIVLDDGIARVVRPGLGERTSHFATCPGAEQHRRRKRHPSARRA